MEEIIFKYFRDFKCSGSARKLGSARESTKKSSSRKPYPHWSFSDKNRLYWENVAENVAIIIDYVYQFQFKQYFLLDYFHEDYIAL